MPLSRPETASESQPGGNGRGTSRARCLSGGHHQADDHVEGPRQLGSQRLRDDDRQRRPAPPDIRRGPCITVFQLDWQKYHWGNLHAEEHTLTDCGVQVEDKLAYQVGMQFVHAIQTSQTAGNILEF